MTPQPLKFDWDAVDPGALVVAPSVHPHARETSALAAVMAAPDRGTQNATILRLVTESGDAGLSDHELHVMTGYSRAIERTGKDVDEAVEVWNMRVKND